MPNSVSKGHVHFKEAHQDDFQVRFPLLWIVDNPDFILNPHSRAADLKRTYCWIMVRLAHFLMAGPKPLLTWNPL